MTNRIRRCLALTTILLSAACAFGADDSPIYRDYGYDMTEDYYVARRQAIKDGKLLFVLSGSDSCNYCAKTKSYLRDHDKEVDARYVCYYARLQNNRGQSEFQGGLPQYGTFDPRTIDAYTGCYDENGTYKPILAWYSGHSGSFYDQRGYSAGEVQKCLDEAEKATKGAPLAKFKAFKLVGPDSLIAGMPTQYSLYAVFEDGVEMLVDHGVEWGVTGSERSTKGTVTAREGYEEVTITAYNTFYDFGVESNSIAKKASVFAASDIESIEIDETPFNLEDNPKVVLKAWATLKNGAKTEIKPAWKLDSKLRYDALPEGAQIWEKTDSTVVLSATNPGEVTYLGDGINVQDHWLNATATVNGLSVSKELHVYGPSRLWPTEWRIVSGDTVAGGSVIKTEVTELKYTYAGEVRTSNDPRLADFEMTAKVDNVPHIVMGTSLSIPESFAARSDTQVEVRLAARRKGGKYTGNFDSLVQYWKEDSKTIRFSKATAYATSTSGIKVNNGWTKIYFPTDTISTALLDADSDNDGFSNALEYLLGTDPKDPKDCWKFTACHFDWPDSIYYRVMFMNTQFPSRTYTIQGKESFDGTWKTLGTMKGEEPGVVSNPEVELATKCHYFRVLARIEEGQDFVIPGLGVYTGPKGEEVDVVIKPTVGERFPAFAVDANNLAYSIYVDVTPVDSETTPRFSVTINESEEGQLNRFALSQALTDEGWFLVHKTEGVWEHFYTTKTPSEVSVIPGKAVAISAESKEAALAIGRLALTDSAAVKAGQEKVVKIVATKVADGRWTLKAEIAPELMEGGHKIDDTVAALGKALSSLSLQPKARAATTSIEIPAESVTSGLYYSLVYADSPDFETSSESSRTLAKPSEALVLEVPADNAPSRFFKVKASMTQHWD